METNGDTGTQTKWELNALCVPLQSVLNLLQVNHCVFNCRAAVTTDKGCVLTLVDFPINHLKSSL